MKKICCLIISLIFILGIFVGCKSPQQTTVKEKINIVDNTQNNSNIESQKLCEYIKNKDIGMIQEIFIEPFSIIRYSEDWDTPNEIKDSLLIDMYREFLFKKYDKNKTLPQNYINKDGGFIYPQDEFEQFIQEHFKISSDYMRKNNEFYDESLKSYLFIGGGIGRKDYLTIKNKNDINYQNNILIIKLNYQYYENNNPMVEAKKELTIEVNDNGKFFYKSYKTIS